MLPFIISTIFAISISPAIINWYLTKNWIDDPEKISHLKKTHNTPTPRGGGLVIFFSMILTASIFLQFDVHLSAIFLGATILTIVGFFDDVYDIHPIIRLGANLLAALCVVGTGIGIAYISNPFAEGVIHLNYPTLPIFFLGQQREIWVLSDIFAVLFIIWNMNIVNWAKGVDGQMPGFVSIAFLFIALLSTEFIDDPTQFNTTVLSLIAAGAFAGLLFWNWYPQKIMPGYGAGSLAGYFLSVLAILSGAKVATMLMVLAVPTADAVFTILRRIRAGKAPYWGDRGHLHHKLIDVLHWGKRRIALFYWFSSLLLGILSLYLNTWGKIATMVLVMLLVFSFLIWAKIQTLRTAAKK